MIDPRAVTKFDRSPAELEEFLLFSIVVAGKNAFQQAAKLEEFIQKFHGGGYTPFGVIRTMDMDGTLEFFLRSVKMGQYERISNAFRGVAHFFKYDPETMRHHPLQKVDIKYLETFKGIGMKTARFFAMHTRQCQWYACLDTHILKWLGELGYDVPKATPRGDRYLQLEQIFLQHARHRDVSPAELDLKIWNERHEKKA